MSVAALKVSVVRRGGLTREELLDEQPQLRDIADGGLFASIVDLFCERTNELYAQAAKLWEESFATGLEMIKPLEFETLESQPAMHRYYGETDETLRTRIACYYPRSILYMDGI